MNFTDIIESPYFTIVLAGIAILGVILTVVFYLKSRRHKQPLYEIARRTLIQNSNPMLSGLSVHYNGAEQKTITVAHVWFWNQGNETINSSDIPTTKPLSIEIDDGVDILDVQLIKVVDEANQCAVGKPTKADDGSYSIPMHFDYLDKGDGMVAQIVHNGDANHRVKVRGKIKGVKTIAKAADAHAFHIEKGRRPTDMMKFMDSPKVVGIITAIVMISGGVALVSEATGADGKWYLWIPAVFCFFIAAMCYPVYLRHIIPRELDVELGSAQQDN